MKLFFYFFFLLALTANTLKADSPLTSTPIHESYSDVAIVKNAHKKGAVNKKLADYLHSASNEIGVKAAIVNAIGWNINGTENAELYTNIIFGKKVNEIDVKSLGADDAFVIGYLLALDDYFHPEKALPFLEAAQEKNNASFTAAIILALAQAQNIMDKGDWGKMWEITYHVFNDKSLYTDMREDAKKIIKDYMILYKN
jgi:hypothetical protein